MIVADLLGCCDDSPRFENCPGRAASLFEFNIGSIHLGPRVLGCTLWQAVEVRIAVTFRLPLMSVSGNHEE